MNTSFFELKGTKVNMAPKENKAPLITFYKSPDFIRPRPTTANRNSKSPKRPKSAALARKHPLQNNQNIQIIDSKKSIFQNILLRQCEKDPPQKYLQRISINRREHMGHKKLLIIQFEGIIGDFVGLPWESEPFNVYFRSNIFQTYDSLHKRFQIIIVFTENTLQKAEFILQLLQKSGIKLDGAYLNIKDPWIELPINYEQIYIDFGISDLDISERIILISSYNTEKTSKELKSLLTSSHNSHRINEIFPSVPIILDESNYKQLPKIILLKNAKLCPNSKVQPLTIIENAINQILDCSMSTNTSDLEENDDIFICETSKIQAFYIDKQNKYEKLNARRYRRKQRIIKAKCKKSESELIEENFTDAIFNQKYLELMLVNEELKTQIYEYYDNSVSQTLSENLHKIAQPDVEKHLPIKHKIIIIKEESGLNGNNISTKYQIVATFPRCPIKRIW